MINAHLPMSSQRSCMQKTKYQREKQRQVLPSPDRPDRKNVREKMLIEELEYILQERDFTKLDAESYFSCFSSGCVPNCQVQERRLSCQRRK